MSSCTTVPPRAYHGDPKIKASAIERMNEHKRLDAIVKGSYGFDHGDGFKGCMIGCLGGEAKHKGVEREFAIPEPINRLFDAIFEGLPEPDHIAFTTDALTAIREGSDLSLVLDHFAIWLLTTPDIGVFKNAFDDGKAAIEQTVGLFRRRISGDAPPQEEWSDARAAAWSAESAAWSASAAALSARAAAWSAESDARAAESAAWSARAAARAAEPAALSAESAAWSAAWKAIAAKLIELLSESPAL